MMYGRKKKPDKKKELLEQQRKIAMLHRWSKPDNTTAQIKPKPKSKSKPQQGFKLASMTRPAASTPPRAALVDLTLDDSPPPSRLNRQTISLLEEDAVPKKRSRVPSTSTNNVPRKLPPRTSSQVPSASSSVASSRSSSPASLDMLSTIDDNSIKMQAIPKLQKIPRISSDKNLGSLVGMMKAPPKPQSGQFQPLYMQDTPKLTPDDFWKSVRDWDFVVDLAKQQEQQQNATEGEKDENAPLRKPLPNTFMSHRQYVAAWAPLCMEEARAQLLSEVLTDIGQNLQNRVPLVLMNVETTAKLFGRDRDRDFQSDAPEVNWCNIRVSLKQRKDGHGLGLQFFTHDVCCLIPVAYKKLVAKLLRGGITKEDEHELKKMAIIGHTEISRKEVDGLILKVSKHQWYKLGKEEMFFLKIGGSITSLREFTALCNVNRLPLLKYVLGQNLPGKRTAAPIAPANYESHADLLQRMGGVKALGEGFTTYAEKKFNPSQLTAIAAAAKGYGDEGFTLIKGPPGSGKTTTLVAVLNSLHIKQYNNYYNEVRRITAMHTGNRQMALDMARKAMPRLLVCAPSNAAVDNVILKIMEDGFMDGSGKRYNPSMIRVGVGKSTSVKDVALETRVDKILDDTLDVGKLESMMKRLHRDLNKAGEAISLHRRRLHAIDKAASWPLSSDWEIKIDEETFEETDRAYFVNCRENTSTYECPTPPLYGEATIDARAMPDYRVNASRTVDFVEKYFRLKTKLERCTIVKGHIDNGASHATIRQALEDHVLDTVHIVMTTLGTAGNKAMEATNKFEVVVVDEAAQSVEPSTLSALQLGSKHAVLVGDPQQLPATIFNVAGRGSKFERSLFQRLEEAGQDVFMLNEQYRMHPKISHFPRQHFYGGDLMDGPNVIEPDYGNPVVMTVKQRVPNFQPFTVLNLDSKEERGGTSMMNALEAHLAVFLFESLRSLTNGLSVQSRVAVITPYSQQAALLKQHFYEKLGDTYERYVEVNTVDAFQGREASIVIFSAVRAEGSQGIGFLSDIRRMNVALTRAKHFLFVIARCESIVVNPMWNDLVKHARATDALLQVPVHNSDLRKPVFGNVAEWGLEENDDDPICID